MREHKITYTKTSDKDLEGTLKISSVEVKKKQTIS